MTNVVWDDNNIEILKREHAAGLSSSQIAAQIPYATRNAIISKIHRLGLTRDDKPKQPPKPKPRCVGVPYHLRRFETIKANVDPGFVETPGNATGVPISEREGAMCCWPLDGDTCCGAATVGFRKPYCVKHARIARRTA